MASEKDITALFSLMHELNGKVDGLSEKVTKNIAYCELCRPIVIGNGQPPIRTMIDTVDKRVVALETRGQVRSKIDLAILAGMFTVIAAGVKVCGDWLPRLFGWW